MKNKNFPEFEADEYWHGYENEPMSGGNPYYACVGCGRTDPEINGSVDKHGTDCSEVMLEQQRRTNANRVVVQSDDLMEAVRTAIDDFRSTPNDLMDEKVDRADMAIAAIDELIESLAQLPSK